MIVRNVHSVRTVSHSNGQHRVHHHRHRHQLQATTTFANGLYSHTDTVPIGTGYGSESGDHSQPITTGCHYCQISSIVLFPIVYYTTLIIVLLLIHISADFPVYALEQSMQTNTAPQHHQSHQQQQPEPNGHSPNGSRASVLLHRLIRATSSVTVPLLNPLPNANPQTQYQPFTILAILPEEDAPLITRALRDAQSRWEVSGHSTSTISNQLKNTAHQHHHHHASTMSPHSNFNNNNDNNSNTFPVPTIRASDIPLTVYSEPTNNDTERIISSVCEWITIHNPVLLLSLLDQQRAFYASIVSQAAGIPFVSLTQRYQSEVDLVTSETIQVRLLPNLSDNTLPLVCLPTINKKKNEFHS